MRKSTHSLSDSMYQIKISLVEIDPPVWRRIRIGGSANLFQLHKVLQTVMGWENAHLHQFIIRGEKYSHHKYEPEESLGETFDEGKFEIGKLLRAGEEFIYEYDFGDGWNHELIVGEVQQSNKRLLHAVCLAGERACPPEDCGGPFRYGNFLEAIKDPNHPEYEELRQWIGGEFDSEKFDLAKVNQVLRRIKCGD